MSDERRELVEPVVREAVPVAAASGDRGDEAGFAQRTEVVRDERLSESGELLELTNRAGVPCKPERNEQSLLVGESAQHGSPCGRKASAELRLVCGVPIVHLRHQQ